MIGIIDGNVKLNHSFKKCDKLIRKAKKISDASLLHFFDLIGLDSSLFKHLTEINIFIDPDENGENEDLVAFYETLSNVSSEYDNSIHLLTKYIDLIINSYNYGMMFDDLVRTIIHETIHANRTIIMNDGVLYRKSCLSKTQNYSEYSDKFFNSINDKKNIFNVLKVAYLKTFANVTVFNKQTNNFEIYRVSNKYIENMKSCAEIESLMNSRFILFDFVESIKNPFDIDKTSFVANYSTIYNNSKELSKKDIHNISLEIEKQRGFEECITECFARIIFYLRDKDEFNFNELLNSKDNTPDILLAFHFIKNLDMDTIRWYFLSCYEEEYTNRFYKLYQNNYFKLIDKINEAYECVNKSVKYPNLNEDIKFIKSLKK